MSTILLVNDSRIIRRKQQRDFSAMGLETLEAGNGEEAINILRSSRPDCILLDILMPVMDGIEFLRTDIAQKLGIPVIVVSSDAVTGERKTALIGMGAREVFSYPADVAAVTAAVQAAIG